jgi:hypothetical protein
MLESEALRPVLDKVDLSVDIALEVVLADVELEYQGPSGFAGNKRRVQPPNRSDQGIVTIIKSTTGINSGSDGYEVGIA